MRARDGLLLLLVFWSLTRSAAAAAARAPAAPMPAPTPPPAPPPAAPAPQRPPAPQPYPVVREVSGTTYRYTLRVERMTPDLADSTLRGGIENGMDAREVSIVRDAQGRRIISFVARAAANRTFEIGKAVGFSMGPVQATITWLSVLPEIPSGVMR
jgi:hypothetical protein